MTEEPMPIAVPEALRGLADHESRAVDALREMREDLERLSGLDERTIELVRLGALVAMGAPQASFGAHVPRAVAAGAGEAEVWGVLMVVAPLVGVPRLLEAVPAIRDSLQEASR